MLGQALLEVFAKGNEVIGWDRDEINITDEKATSFKLHATSFDLIINAAAFNDVDKAQEEPEIANAVNGYAVGNLAKICKELEMLIVHYSSEYVFDGTKKEGYREDDEPRPISAYGQSKYLGEQELQKNTDKFYLIRLSRLFGQEAQGVGAKRSFVSKMLELGKTKSELEVVDEEVSCPTYAPDLAKLTRYIVDDKREFGIYHGANFGSCTWYEFTREIFKTAGINVKLIPVPASRFPRPARRPAYGVLLNTKLPQQRRWQEALREELAQKD